MVRTQMLPIGQICKNNHGFSLLEILIVLVIMSLMLSIAIPNFNKMFASVENAREGSKVMHLLKKARAEAIFKAKPVDIIFYADGKCSFTFRDQHIEYTDLHMTILLDEEKQDYVVQTFQPDGTALHPLLVFKTFQGNFITYNFNPVNGKIEMERGSRL